MKTPVRTRPAEPLAVHPFLSLVGLQVAIGTLIALWFVTSFGLAVLAFLAVLVVWYLGIARLR